MTGEQVSNHFKVRVLVLNQEVNIYLFLICEYLSPEVVSLSIRKEKPFGILPECHLSMILQKLQFLTPGQGTQNSQYA